MNLLDQNFVSQVLQEAFSASETDYRRVIDAQWRVLRGDLYPFVRGDLEKTYPKTFESFTVSDINLSKKVTHKRAQAYKKSPIRLLDDETQTNNYQDLLSSINAQAVFRTFDTYYNFFKYAAVWFNYYDDANGKQKITLRALRPNQFRRVVNERGETILFLVFFGETESSAVNVRGDGQKSMFQDEPEDNKNRTVGIWTKDQHILVKVKVRMGKVEFANVEMENNPTGVNPLGMIPAVFAQEGDEFDRPSFNSLANQTVTMNTMLSTIITGMNAQAFGQLVIKYPENQKMPDVLQQGMLTFLKLPQAGEGESATEADYISPSPDLANALNVFYSYVSAVLDEHQITVTAIKGDAQTFASGLDRLIAQADTNEVVEGNQELYSLVEKNLYLLVKAFHDLKSQFLFPSESLMIKYHKPSPMMSEKEILDNAKTKLEMGIIEPYEVLQALDPNISDEDAMERTEEIKRKSVDVISSLRGDIENQDKKEMEFINASKPRPSNL
jgi:hypothetical protein